MDFLYEHTISLLFGFIIIMCLVLFILLKISEKNEAKSKKN